LGGRFVLWKKNHYLQQKKKKGTTHEAQPAHKGRVVLIAHGTVLDNNSRGVTAETDEVPEKRRKILKGQ